MAKKNIEMESGQFPRLRCGDCGEFIELAKTGVDAHAKVVWNKAGDVKFMHQNCDDESYSCWEPIETFFRHLVHNARLNLKKPDLFEEAFGVASKPRGKQV